MAVNPETFSSQHALALLRTGQEIPLKETQYPRRLVSIALGKVRGFGSIEDTKGGRIQVAYLKSEFDVSKRSFVWKLTDLSVRIDGDDLVRSTGDLRQGLILEGYMWEPIGEEPDSRSMPIKLASLDMPRNLMDENSLLAFAALNSPRLLRETSKQLMLSIQANPVIYDFTKMAAEASFDYKGFSAEHVRSLWNKE